MAEMCYRCGNMGKPAVPATKRVRSPHGGVVPFCDPCARGVEQIMRGDFSYSNVRPPSGDGGR